MSALSLWSMAFGAVALCATCGVCVAAKLRSTFAYDEQYDEHAAAHFGAEIDQAVPAFREPARV